MCLLLNMVIHDFVRFTGCYSVALVVHDLVRLFVFKMVLSNCPGTSCVKKFILTRLIFQSYFFQEIVRDLVWLLLPQSMFIQMVCLSVPVPVLVYFYVHYHFCLCVCLSAIVRALYVVHLVYMSLSSFPSSFSSFNLYKLNWYVCL